MSLKEELEKKFKSANFFTGDSIPKIERISTRIAGLDLFWGGGLPKGRISEVSGGEHLGKTALSLALCRGMQDQGLQSLIVDLERTIETTQIESAGLDPDEVLIAHADYGEQAIDIALEAAENGASLVIIDSLPMLMPKASAEKIDDDSAARDVAGIASLLDRCRIKMVQTIERTGSHLLFINQVRDKMNSPYGGLNTPGGHTIKHLFSIRTQLTHASTNKDKKGEIITHVKSLKNKTFSPMFDLELLIIQGGVQRGASLASSACTFGLLNKEGSWIKYEVPGSNPKKEIKWNGLVAAGKALEADPELYDLIYKKTMEVGLGTPAD